MRSVAADRPRRFVRPCSIEPDPRREVRAATGLPWIALKTILRELGYPIP